VECARYGSSQSINDGYPDDYLDEIQEKFLLASGRTFDTRTILRKLTGPAIRYSLKVARAFSAQRNKDNRNDYKAARKVALKRANMACIIDESARHWNMARRKRMWGRRGVQTYRRARYISHGNDRFALLAAGDVNGFIKEACGLVWHKTSANDTDPTRGTIDGERVELWVEEFF